MKWHYPRYARSVVTANYDTPGDNYRVQARGSQQRYSERHRETFTALQAARDRADVAEEQLKYLKETMADQEGKIRRLEHQLEKSHQVRAITLYHLCVLKISFPDIGLWACRIQRKGCKISIKKWKLRMRHLQQPCKVSSLSWLSQSNNSVNQYGRTRS